MDVLKFAIIFFVFFWQLRGDPDIIISEINSCSPNKNKQREFAELHFVDMNRFLMLRNPRLRSGPSLKNHYMLVIKAYDNKYGGPVISTVVDLTQNSFKFDNPYFTISTRTFPNADLYFECSEVVYTTQNAAGIEQCEGFLDDGNKFPVGVLLIVTPDRKFIAEHITLNAIRPYVFITDEIINFLKESVVDAVAYGRNAKTDRAELFDKIIESFKITERYVLRDYDYIGDSDLSLGKCPTGNGSLSLRQPFTPGLFKLGQPTHGEQNDCSASTFFLDMLSSPNLSTLREDLLRKPVIAAKQYRNFPPFKASECLMKHTRNNLNPTECGQVGSEAGAVQNLSQLAQISMANERYSGSLVSLAEAILARSDGFYQTADHDLENILVCNKHAEDFGREWFRKLPGTVRQGQRVLTCKFPSIPDAPDPHAATTVARTNLFVSKEESEAVLQLKNVFIPTGWPLCQSHKEYVNGVLDQYTAATLHKLEEEKQLNQRYFLRPKNVCKPLLSSQNMDNSEGGSQRSADTCSEYVPSQEKMEIEVPAKSSIIQEIEEIQNIVRQLATAAKVSKLRFSNDLSTCKRRTLEEYARIGRRLSNAVCFAIAPFQSGELSKLVVADTKRTLESGKDIEKLQSLMQAIADSYGEAKSSALRNMILSLIAPFATYSQLAELIPTLSPYKFKRARLYSKIYGPGTQPTEIMRTRSSIPKIKLTSFIDFLLSDGVSVELPYGEVRVKLSSGETERIPNLLRVMNDEYTADLYITILKNLNETNPTNETYGPELYKKLELSKSSLLRILRVLKSSHRQQIRGLDYFHAYGSNGFDTLTEVVMKLEDSNLVDKDWSTSVKTRLHDLHYFLKAEFRGRIRETSQMADFCSVFALSDPDNNEFTATKTTITELISTESRLLIDTIEDVAINVKEANYSNSREKAEAEYLVGVAKNDIQNWKAHIIRTYRQNLGRQRVMENLESHQIIIWIDWAMKWLPERAREDQPSFFGKAGIPWHVSVAYKRNRDSSGYDVRYFVHSFQSTVQDSAAVVGIINDTLTRIKAECSYITEATIFSDNAGCYKSGSTIATMPRMKADTGIAVVRWDFSDPQSGKGPADRFAATAKRKARMFLAEGNNCDSSDAFVTCISSHGGTEGMTAIVSQLECGDNIGKASKIRDITKLHNFQFNDNNLLVHRAYGIGRGRTVPLATLNPTYWQCHLKPIRVVNRGTEQNTPLTSDSHWKSLVAREPAEAEQHLDEDEDVGENDEIDVEKLKSSASLFTCPFPGCTKVFQRYKNLQIHLELGKHQLKPEKESLRDFVIREYKDRVERLQLNRFQEMREAIREVGVTLTCPPDIVNDSLKGWALRTRKVERYSTKVRNYLDEKFDEGVKNPRHGKWKPDALSKAMRNDDRFDANDYLKPQQIAAYFSRLAKQREKQPSTDPEEPRNEADGEEDELQNDEPNDFEEDLSHDTTDEAINEVRTELNAN